MTSPITGPVISKASKSTLDPVPGAPYLSERDLIGDADGWRARLLRCDRDTEPGSEPETESAPSPATTSTFIATYVLNGEIALGCGERERLVPGDLALTWNQARRLGRSQDSVTLEIELPVAWCEAHPVARSVVHAQHTPYSPHPRNATMVRRDLGAERATEGALVVQLSRLQQPFSRPSPLLVRTEQFHFVFIAQGICRVDFGEHGEFTLIPGDAVHVPSGLPHRLLELSDDYECIEVYTTS